VITSGRCQVILAASSDFPEPLTVRLLDALEGYGPEGVVMGTPNYRPAKRRIKTRSRHPRALASSVTMSRLAIFHERGYLHELDAGAHAV
jgi:hypothetical protein